MPAQPMTTPVLSQCLNTNKELTTSIFGTWCRQNTIDYMVSWITKIDNRLCCWYGMSNNNTWSLGIRILQLTSSLWLEVRQSPSYIRRVYMIEVRTNTGINSCQDVGAVQSQIHEHSWILQYETSNSLSKVISKYLMLYICLWNIANSRIVGAKSLH